MNKGKAFLSYVQKDDESDKGRIHQFARDVKSEYNLLSSDEIELFFDKDNIQYGDDWKSKIDLNIYDTRYFMPIITPSYFKSSACRDEFNYFYSKAEALGVKDLIIPVYYVTAAEVEDDSSDDELAKKLRTYQWVDLREARLLDSDSSTYRILINRVAERILSSNTIEPLPTSSPAEPTDDEPGEIELLRDAESNIPALNQHLTLMASHIGTIGQTSIEHTPSNISNLTFAERLSLIRNYVFAVRDDAEAFYSESKNYVDALHRSDPGVRLLISKMKNPDSSEDSTIKQEFFDSIRGLYQKSIEAGANTPKVVEAFSNLNKLSKEFRPLSDRVTKGFTFFEEGNLVLKGWDDLISKV